MKGVIERNRDCIICGVEFWPHGPSVKYCSLQCRIARDTDSSAGENACWPWIGGKTGRGYGHFVYQGQNLLAHRCVAHFATGIPFDEIEVAMHSCDNPICVNPKHISVGSFKANMEDKMNKRREDFTHAVKGSKHPRATITEQTALAIFRAKGTAKEVAARYGVKLSCVHNIRYGINWNSVTGLPVVRSKEGYLWRN